MKVFINGNQNNLNEGLNLLQLLEKNFPQKSSTFAVALNNEFIPKSKYKDIIIKEDDRIEVVSAQPGG